MAAVASVASFVCLLHFRQNFIGKRLNHGPAVENVLGVGTAGTHAEPNYKGFTQLGWCHVNLPGLVDAAQQLFAEVVRSLQV